jgi:hypothetical protein
LDGIVDNCYGRVSLSRLDSGAVGFDEEGYHRVLNVKSGSTKDNANGLGLLR